MAAREQAGSGQLLLDIDPELGTGIAEHELVAARSVCRASLVRLDPGRWESLGDMAARDDFIGFLVVDGLLCREVGLRDSHIVELLGRGDVVVAPPAADWPRLGGNTNVTAIEPTIVARLGCSFAQAAGRWTSLYANVQRRLESQRERLAVQGLIAHVPQAEHRLLLQLWHLGTWWGRITPDGMTVPFQLTHGLLGQLIAARRPTVTLAVRELETQGYLRRADDGTWLLTSHAERAVTALIGSGGSRLIGETLMARHKSATIRAESAALRAGARPIRSASEDGGERAGLALEPGVARSSVTRRSRRQTTGPKPAARG